MPYKPKHWNYGTWISSKPKAKKSSKKRTFLYKGVKLIPLTPGIAATLDRGDRIKYVGPINTYSGLWRFWQRKVVTLSARPEISGKKIRIKYYGTSYACPLEHLALAERGDPDEKNMRHAERFIPLNLKGFKRNISELVRRTQENIDAYLNDLPLHKKLELFKKLTPAEKVIYECLYKDIEVLIGLKEDESSGLPPEG